MESENTIGDDLATHFKFMRIALNQAECALSKNEVPVGCIFVYDNTTILSSGMNSTNDTLSGIMHAELYGIEQILRKFGLQQDVNKYNPQNELRIQELFGRIDLYVTVEPCVMCGSALRQMGIRRVFFGAGNDRFGGNGSIYRLNHDDLGIVSNQYKERCQKMMNKTSPTQNVPIEMIESFDKTYNSYPDFGREEAIILLRKFYVQENKKAPVPQTRESDNRFLSLTNFPVMHYDKYVTFDEFEDIYGPENVYRFERANVENNHFITEEGIEVEKFFDPLMPIKQSLYNEIKAWELQNDKKVIDDLVIRIDSQECVNDVMVKEEHELSIQRILKDIDESLFEKDDKEAPTKKQKI